MKASKLVVVSAGAFGSPSILERSGIGAPSVLEQHSIPVLVDLPGVGENYQGRSTTVEVPCLETDALCVTDHLGVCSVYYAADETETMDDVWNDPKAIAGEWFIWLSYKMNISVSVRLASRMGEKWDREDCSQVRCYVSVTLMRC